MAEHFQRLRRQRPYLHLYGLVDGTHYQCHTGQHIAPDYPRNLSLFAATKDASLAAAGPWLFDLTAAPEALPLLAELEQAQPAVIWLFNAFELYELASMLRPKLDGALVNDSPTLLRFYDPRVLGNLYHVMNDAQRSAFFAPVGEWYFLYQGKRVKAGVSHV